MTSGRPRRHTGLGRAGLPAVEEAEAVLEDAQRQLRRVEAAYAHFDVLVPRLP